jgi:hypothetical protein
MKRKMVAYLVTQIIYNNSIILKQINSVLKFVLKEPMLIPTVKLVYLAPIIVKYVLPI